MTKIPVSMYTVHTKRLVYLQNLDASQVKTLYIIVKNSQGIYQPFLSPSLEY